MRNFRNAALVVGAFTLFTILPLHERAQTRSPPGKPDTTKVQKKKPQSAFDLNAKLNGQNKQANEEKKGKKDEKKEGAKKTNYSDEGDQKYASGVYAAAIDSYKQALKEKNADKTSIYEKIGDSYTMQDKYQKAVDAYLDAINELKGITTQNQPTYYALCKKAGKLLLNQLGNPSEAKKYLAVNLSDGENNLLVGKALEKMGKTNAAYDSYCRAVKLLEKKLASQGAFPDDEAQTASLLKDAINSAIATGIGGKIPTQALKEKLDILIKAGY
ncbi:MAG: hypothetical protein NTX79_04530 [Candidatus Micrarchaeota archaeon]|nr:hypothetical protein [Candidatus Micrarchaeota archaeon]